MRSMSFPCRRTVLCMLAMASPALAQHRSRTPRIAILEWEPATGADRLVPFRNALEEEGYVDGRSIVIDPYFSEGRLDRAEEFARRIATGPYDVVVAFTTPAAHAMKRAASGMPIVFAAADPVGTGLVSNLSRPGGNITGVSSMLTDIEPKRIELMRELLPEAKRFAYLASNRDPASDAFVQAAETAAARLGVTLTRAGVQSPDEIDSVVAAAVNDGAQGFLIQALFMLSNHSAGLIAEIVRRRRVPAIGIYATFVRHGGLASFGPQLEFPRRRAARIVARILSGTPAGDIPVEQPTEFELSVNVRAAKELGLTVPPLVLARATEVIE